MAEYRRVQLHLGVKAKGHLAASSTFNYENRRYFLDGANILSVEKPVADAWVSADSNVVIMVER